MELYERARKAADYILSIKKEIPETAVVLGSGLGAFGESIKVDVAIPYSDIPQFPVSTVVGHAGKMIFGKVGEKSIVAMQGRFHRYEGYEMEDVTLYIRVFALLGIKNLILTNASGAINTSFVPGDLMLITDHIACFCDSPLFGKNDERFGVRFPSMSDAYSKKLQNTAQECAKNCGIDLKEGAYIYSKGPSYETPAEIRAFRMMGADACGMSTAPETIVAVHCGINVLGISCITNMAAGILDQPLSHTEVVETGKRVEEKFKKLITSIVTEI